MSNITLWDDIIRVPQILQRCSLACGLKEMRLVNRATRTAMVALVEGCTVRITDADPATELVPMITMLKHAMLKRLRVELSCGFAPQSSPRTLCDSTPSPHIEQMNVFLEGMREAIKNVVALEIDASPTSDGEALQLLAQAVPDVTQLHVSQHISKETLACFGSACSKLSTLHVIGALTGCKASETPNVLPNLTHLHFIDPNYTLLSAPPFADTGLTSSMTVVTYGPVSHLSLHGYSMTAEVWRNLPLCVQHLDFDALACLPASSPILPRLLSLKLRSWWNRFHVGVVAAIIRRAPQCKLLELVNRPGLTTQPDSKPYMCAGGQPNIYEDLTLFDRRVANGLQMPQGFNVLVYARMSPMNNMWSLDQFLSSLPVMRSISGLALDVARSVDALLLGDLAAKFPHLTTFGLFSYKEATTAELLPLTLCKSLQRVLITSVMDIQLSSALISMLCTPSLPSLASLHLQRPRDPLLAAQMIAAAESPQLPVVSLCDDPRVSRLRPSEVN